MKQVIVRNGYIPLDGSDDRLTVKLAKKPKSVKSKDKKYYSMFLVIDDNYKRHSEKFRGTAGKKRAEKLASSMNRKAGKDIYRVLGFDNFYG